MRRPASAAVEHLFENAAKDASGTGFQFLKSQLTGWKPAATSQAGSK